MRTTTNCSIPSLSSHLTPTMKNLGPIQSTSLRVAFHWECLVQWEVTVCACYLALNTYCKGRGVCPWSEFHGRFAF